MPVAFEDENLILEKIATRPFGTNAYIITCRNTGEAVLIDAPGEEEKISAALKRTEPRFDLETSRLQFSTRRATLLEASVSSREIS